MSDLPDLVPETPAARPSPAVQASRWGALLAALALGLLAVGWELAWAPTGRGTLAIKAVPLFLALPGLWRLRLYTYRWLSLVVWLYVTEGLVRATSESGTGATLALVEVVLGVLLFTACALHVRQRLAAGRAVVAAATAPTR
ncbi:DUF2069 domain-containing protein [Leptothrix discophora]|uniref:DUF2069 domain-containing protein n=1 Tax=Leptothrix discophora TaxID=89 RepID=A0ABT9G6V5_LEPDI|nr:DUF2069 domain-containing protein [Leptothrix discophora]MDP4302145.1 DUF2069 domain-containing protein [Leptothrix discophora]